MRRPGVPHSPRSNDRGEFPKPKNPRSSRERSDTSPLNSGRAQTPSRRRGERTQKEPERAGGQRPSVESRFEGVAQTTRYEAKPVKNKGTRKTSLFKRKEKGEEQSETEQQALQTVGDSGATTSVKLRRYFTPKRASATFGSSEQSGELDARRVEVKRARLRAIFARVAILAAALVVIAAIAWGVFFSPFFALSASKIEIAGAGEEASESDVEQTLVQFQGVPLTRMSMSSVEAAVEGITQVQSATAQRVWPDGLKVNVQARVPIAAVKTDGGYDLLDREGVTLRTVPEVPEGIVVATLNAETDKERASAMASIATVHEALAPELAERIETYIASPLTLEMRTSDGRVIKWGDATENDLKARVVLLLLDQRPAQVYDVSTPQRPVTS